MHNEIIDERKLKADLLLEYSERNPKRLYKIDARNKEFMDTDHEGEVDGMIYESGDVYSLVKCHSVRVLIDTKTTHENAIKALHGFIKVLEDMKDCERCGKLFTAKEHHPACYDNSLTDEQVRAISHWQGYDHDYYKQQGLERLPF